LFKINEMDSIILKDLLQDGRKGFAEIAKEIRATKNKVWKRYKAMQRKGIITGATVQTNFSSFGYEAIATLLINVDAQQIEQFMDYIGKMSEVLAYRQYSNFYNVRAFATLTQINELDRVKQAIKRKLPTVGLKTYLWTDMRNMPENLKFIETSGIENNGNQHNLQSQTSARSNRMKIDDLDLKIMEKLESNGRAPFAEIAREMGTSTDTIVKRYYKLKENGAMKVSIQINPNVLGYAAILDFNIAFSSPGGPSGNVVEAIAKIPDVIIITKTSGDYDLQLTAMIRDVKQSFAIQDQISAIVGVTKMDVSTRKIPNEWPTSRQCLSTF